MYTGYAGIVNSLVGHEDSRRYWRHGESEGERDACDSVTARILGKSTHVVGSPVLND